MITNEYRMQIGSRGADVNFDMDRTPDSGYTAILRIKHDGDGESVIACHHLDATQVSRVSQMIANVMLYVSELSERKMKTVSKYYVLDNQEAMIPLEEALNDLGYVRAPDLVPEPWACPECHEREMDKLAISNYDVVTCETCGCAYAIS